jgi:retron-type reverse transcriptase
VLLIILAKKSMDRLYTKLYSLNNLKLAWSRLKTAQNIYYKNFYRDLFLAYDINSEENLINLSARIKGKSYKPSRVMRFYTPKSSGLHRPITFLCLDDLIVYQAFANIIAEKFDDQRKVLENVNVFSNIINRNIDKDLFFYKKWQEGV